MKTTIPKENEIERSWYLVDAAGKSAGRLAVDIADILRGKNKPIFTPHVDTGDFIVVVNAEKVALTGNKEEQKMYQSYSGFTNGLRKVAAGVIRRKKPEKIIRQAVWGMLPHNRMGRHLIKRLKIYSGTEHPHTAQQPAELKLG